MGNRIAKYVYDGTELESSTFYVRDAQGTTIAVYDEKVTIEEIAGVNTPTLKYALAERHIYGSSRLGMDTTEVVIPVNATLTVEPTAETNVSRYLGKRLYELSNHLGNVLTVISDRKMAVPMTNSNAFWYFSPHIVSVTDYSPFGVALTARTWSDQEYRYGFNGKELDKEGMGGGATTYDYGFRIYNSALGKFLSVDPLSTSYPWYSTFQFAGNMPIWAIDLDGCEPLICQEQINNQIGQPTVKLSNGRDAIVAQGYYVISYHYPGGDPNSGIYYYCRIGGNEWVQFHPLSMSDMHFQKIQKQFQGIARSMDIMLVGAVVGAGSILTLGAAIEIFGTQAVATWLAEEAVETIFENITGIPVVINPMDVIQKGVGTLYKGSYKKLKSYERQRAAEYMSEGKIVERIKEAPNVEPRCDFIVDGKYTEFRFLENLKYNAATALTKLQDATIKTNVQVIDLDIRKPGGTAQNARDLYARFLGTKEGKAFQGEVRIATSEGLLTFKK